jgi:hypothetical protein
VTTLADLVAAARVSGDVVRLSRGVRYELDAPLAVHDVHIRCPDGGAIVAPSASFSGAALLRGNATTKRATVLDGLILDPEGSGARAIDTHRTQVHLLACTARGPIRLSEASRCKARGGNLKAGLLLDDAYLTASDVAILGDVVGIGRIGGGSAGLAMTDCVHEGGDLDVRSDDNSGFRAVLSSHRHEGGRIVVGPYGLVQLSQYRQVGGSVVATFDGATGLLSAVQCLAAGRVIQTPDPSRVVLVACYREASTRGGALESWYAVTP